MLIHSASQLLTLAGGPQRGRELGQLGLIPDGAVLIQDEKIAAVGTTRELCAAYPNEPDLDAGGRVVMPGFVDPHTHAIWAGDRSAEFELRLQGKSYLEILAEGGGILSTVRASPIRENACRIVKFGVNIFCDPSQPNAPVAQWIEQRIPNPFVGCSIHPRGTSAFAYFFFCFCCPTRTFCSGVLTSTLTWVAEGQTPTRHLAAGTAQMRQNSPSMFSQPAHWVTIGFFCSGA